uniref:Uncharacterized protein n=2 Tax=Odontella aurita TaxID=265563 RepID=A0A7S4JZ62_9STRA|mmetsp:Transcript_57687/g.172122  ORF Transcript_57687/g.172122 Transcript_57687/m.172122 type:complete len:395 (+) Transcript_57687:777-1961(+)
MGELDRKSWYMVATDSRTLLKELARQSADADPRDAGLDTWELLMEMIGRGETAEECSGDFDDLILKEWALERLTDRGDDDGDGGLGLGSIERLIGMVMSSKKEGKEGAGAEEMSGGGVVTEGALLRAGSMDRSPFLLSNQEYHKSVVLVISDDEYLTVGVLLNRPAAKGLEMEIVNEASGGKRRKVTVPLLYGGQYAVKGQSPLLWLHCSDDLRSAEVGSPFGDAVKGIFKCSQDEATRAISAGVAKPDDFLVVSGVSVWTKGDALVGGGGMMGELPPSGLEGEVDAGRFEVVGPDRVNDVWRALQRQEVVTKLNLVQNLALAGEAWRAGTVASEAREGLTEITATEGIGEGYDEEGDGDEYVHDSDTRVADLSDTALRSWVATFLLGAPSLGS